MLEEKLREAAQADEHIREQIIRDFASRPGETLPALIHRLRSGPKGGTALMAAQVIHAIGYPRNQHEKMKRTVSLKPLETMGYTLEFFHIANPDNAGKARCLRSTDHPGPATAAPAHCHDLPGPVITYTCEFHSPVDIL